MTQEDPDEPGAGLREWLRPIRDAIPILAVAAVVGVVAYQVAETEPPSSVPRMDGVPLRTWAASALDSTAAEAGVSFSLRPAIRPLDARGLGMLKRIEGYRAFVHRCSSCHAPPDPSMRKPDGWHWVVRRMATWMDRAGLMPMPTADSLAIIQFLEQASSPTR